jgi:serine/threonine protein kinase
LTGRETQTLRLDPPVAAPPGNADTPAPRLPPPAQPSVYEVLDEVGRGGMSVVHLARDRRLGRFVALKRLGAAFVHSPAMKERFFREATSIATLNHPHIVHLYDLAEDAEGPYLVMEYVPGPGTPPGPNRPAPSLNLEQKVDQNGAPLSFRAAVELVRKLCRAMDYAHSRRVIHRDLKPSNVLLDESGEPKIVDFGLARRTTRDEVRLTLTGSKLLSLGYSAPEQESDTSSVDERADIYGLGGILYFALTGENPRFFRESKVPPLLRPVLLRALENDRDRRWASVREFEEALFQEGNLYASPTTDMGMWRCKWCNGLNPMDERFCEACGGDGREVCPECGHETRIGVRFCPACHADIKAFEEARGLLERLRHYRRQKDFPRMMIEKDAAAHFQPTSEKGQTLQREIAELLDTAGWALNRKEDLQRAIAGGMDAKDYEAVRDRLSEYELMDESPAYTDLKAGLPWRIAERDAGEFAAQVNRARSLFAERQLAAARHAIGELRVRKAQLDRLETFFPVLKGKLTVGGEPQSRGEENTLALDIQTAATALDTLDAELTAAEARVAQLSAETQEALDTNRYERCLELADTLRAVTADPTPVDEAVEKARTKLEEIRAHLRRAEQALAFGKHTVAERLCLEVTERLQRHCQPAEVLLARVRRERWVRNLRRALAAVVVFVALYALSIGPAYRLARSAPALDAAYAPLRWLHAHTPLRAPLERYAALFNARPFEPRPDAPR